LVEIRRDLVRAVLVAEYCGGGDVAEEDRPALVIRRRQVCVESLEHPLGDARHVAEPGRRADHDDVGGEDARTQRRPAIAAAHVGVDAGSDVEVDDPHDVAVETVGGEAAEELFGDQLATGILWRVLEGAVEQQDGLVGDAHHGLPGRDGRAPRVPVLPGLDARRGGLTAFAPPAVT
jgi:hypothetical protein